MAIAELTAQRNSTGGAASTSVTFTYPSTPTQGNLLVAVFSWRGDTTVTGTPSGWSLATNSGNASGLDGAIYYKIAGASEPTVHTWTLGASNKFAGCASEWSGIVSVSPLDKTNSNTGTGTAGTCGLTGTLSQADELVVSMFSNIDIYTWASHDNGATEIREAASTGGSTTSRNNTSLATKIVSATTSVNYGATLSTSGAWSSAVATFKADTSVNVALTGQSCTVAQGSVTDATSAAITGQSCAVAIGNLIEETTRSLTGQGCTVTQESLGVSAPAANVTALFASDAIVQTTGISGASLVGGSLLQSPPVGDTNVALTGQSVTVAIGSITETLTTALTGAAVALSLGSVTPYTETSVQLTGQSVSVAQDSLSKTTTASLSGQNATVAQGTATATSNFGISGQSATIENGLLVISLNSGLTGTALPAASGSLTSSNSLAVTGQAAIIGQGSAGIGVGVSGHSLSVAQGSVANGGIDTAITGQSLTVNQSNIVGDASVGLSGQSISVATEQLAASVNSALTGQAITAAIESVTADTSLSISSQAVQVSQGSIAASQDASAALTGQAVTANRGDIAASATKALSGQALIASDGSMLAAQSVQLTGGQVGANAGYLGLGARHKRLQPLTGIGHEINGVLASPEALAVYRQSFTEGGSLLPTLAGDSRTDTGYPVISSVTETTFGSDSTSHAVSMPATVNAGDGLIVIITTDGSATVTTPNGWRRLYTRANGTALRGSAYAKVARGTEGGSTVDFVTSAAETGAAQVYRITNWNGTLAGIQAGQDAEITTGSTVDMPAVTSYWGTAKTIWLAALHTSTSQTASSAPTNYTNLTQTSSGASTSHAQCITSRYSTNAASEDPGTYTMSGSGASKVYNTIAIAPGYVGAYYEHFEITRSSTTLWAGLYASQPHMTSDTSIERAVIVLHGSGLDAAEYVNVVLKNLTDYLGRVIVLTPFFAEAESDPETDQLFWGSSWPELGRSDASLAWRISSGEVLDELITHLYATFTNLTGVIIAGHSAGGQLANRYSAASSDIRNRYLVSAPSSYVYPTNKRTDGAGGWTVPSSPSTFNDWKYGLDNLSTISYVDAIGAATLRSRLSYARVHYLVGANDNDPADTSMDLSADAAVQGSTRVERQQLYHDYLIYWDTLDSNNFTSLLTGQVAPVATGAVSKSVSITLTGQSLAANQGSISATQDINAALTGQNISVSSGSLATETTRTLSGHALLINQNTVVGDVSIATIGQAIQADLGSISGTIATSISSQSTTAQTGDITASASITLSGQSLTASQGGISATQNINVALSGQFLNTSINSVNVDFNSTLSSQNVVIAQGFVGVGIGISGQNVSLSQGSVIPGTGASASLTGQSVSVAQNSLSTTTTAPLLGQNSIVDSGTITELSAVAISGHSVIVERGNLSFTTGGSSMLSGEGTIVEQGNFESSRNIGLSGQDVIVAQGSTTASITVPLSGQNLALSQGVVLPAGSEIFVPITGHALSIGQGALDPHHYLISQIITATLGTETVTATLGTETIIAEYSIQTVIIAINSEDIDI